jgi:Kef-type K+ transport system membrane component KefB
MHSVTPTFLLSLNSLLQVGLDQIFVARCALFFAIVLCFTVGLGKLGEYLFKMPAIASQIISGIIIGQTGFDIASWPIFSMSLLLQAGDATISLVIADCALWLLLLLSAILTVPFILWQAGHETDVRSMNQVGIIALIGGLLGALLPIGGVILTWYCLLYNACTFATAVGIGIAFAATSVSIPVAMLTRMRKMHLRSSQVTLGAAVVDDVLAVLILSLFIVALSQHAFGNVGVHVSMHGQSLSGALFGMGVVFVLLGSIGYFVIPLTIRVLEKSNMAEFIAPIATGTMLLVFSFVELVGGLAGITGAYFAGLLHQFGDKEHRAHQIISPFVASILLPLYVGSIGIQINLRLLSCYDWLLVFVLLLVAIITKMIGCWVATYCAQDNWHPAERYLFGASMVARGEVGLVVSSILYNAALFDVNYYMITVAVIVLTTIAAPILLKIGFIFLEKSQESHSLWDS